MPLEAPLLLMPWKTDVVQLVLEQISYCLCFYVSQAPVLKSDGFLWSDKPWPCACESCTSHQCIPPSMCLLKLRWVFQTLVTWSCKFPPFYYWVVFTHIWAWTTCLYLKISTSSLSPQRLFSCVFFWKLCSFSFYI